MARRVWPIDQRWGPYTPREVCIPSGPRWYRMREASVRAVLVSDRIGGPLAWMLGVEFHTSLFYNCGGWEINGGLAWDRIAGFDVTDAFDCRLDRDGFVKHINATIHSLDGGNETTKMTFGLRGGGSLTGQRGQLLGNQHDVYFEFCTFENWMSSLL